MPIFVPNGFPPISKLAEENIKIYSTEEEKKLKEKGVPNPLRILFLNLMPLKRPYELQIVRLLSPCPFPVEIVPMKVETRKASHGEGEHIKKFYKGFTSLRHEHFDGMIVTGAPVEHLPFEKVDYWKELCEIFDWAKTNINSSFYICWGAVAALFYFYGINKVELGGKRIGLFEHSVLKNGGIFHGSNNLILEPHTRETGFDKKEILLHPEIEILAESNEAGPLLCMANGGRDFFMMGHPEYDPETVCKEYARDKGNGINVLEPTHLVADKKGDTDMQLNWRADGTVIYTNWIAKYVAKNTPWDFKSILEN